MWSKNQTVDVLSSLDSRLFFRPFRRLGLTVSVQTLSGFFVYPYLFDECEAVIRKKIVECRNLAVRRVAISASLQDESRLVVKFVGDR